MAKRVKAEVSAEADMTPMIDMTFQLIAFFMVLINFADDNQNQRIKLPSSELAKPPEGPAESPITLQLTKQGIVLYDAEEIAISEMKKKLQLERQILTRNGKSASQANVIIRADGDTPTGVVQDLIKACQDEKFEKFALRARQEKAPSYGN
jgi:biopolymer transport protein ExbD